MKYKLSVIFLLICLVLILIYNKFNKSNFNILYIGDNKTFYNLSDKFNDFNIDKYLFNNVTYKELNSYIKNNDYKVIKEKNIYLNQMIRKSDVIILNANNFEYKLKCMRNDRIINEYNSKVLNDINNLATSLKSIVDVKIFVIGNYCKNSDIKFESNNFIFIEYEEKNDIDKILLKYINN